MTNYFAVFTRGPSEASDAALSSEPVESTKILAAPEYASVVKVEAGTEGHAAQAARAAYPGRANTKLIVVTEAQWKEQ